MPGRMALPPRKLRGSDQPVIMLTAKGEDVDRIIGLKSGRMIIWPGCLIRGN